jgi:hypothetical protein
MRFPRPLSPLLYVIAAVVVPLRPAAGQEPAGREFGVQAMTVLEDPLWAGGGVYAAWRPGGKTRLAVTLGLGSLGGTVAGRGELLAHFLLSPGRLSGVTVYGLGGIAGVVGRRDQGYLVLGLGLEHAPGAASGWVIEAGVGGGARILAGWRWRWLSPTRRPEP